MAENAITDIIVTTHNRLSYLRHTLDHIYRRTRTPYRLHVIDDASEKGNAEWLWGEYVAGRVHHLHLRGEHVGPMANLNLGFWSSFSDPFVFCDDDVLCPDLEPDWLAQGLTAMGQHQSLAMLALRHPGAKVKVYHQDTEVAFCKSLGATFLFCRRQFIERNPLPHERGGKAWPLEPRCKAARASGWDIGVLKNVFCYHIGEVSALNDKPYPGKFVKVKDWQTLEPVKRYW
jgi:GT2 family glycosyltransferase